jgi:2-furoate---CoA ligase
VTTAYDLVWLACERTPNHVALVDDRTGRALSYRELLFEVDAVAAGLFERGIRAGSRVATVLPNVFEHFIAILALARLAAVPALLNVRLQPAEIGQLILRGEMSGAIVAGDNGVVVAASAALPPDAPLFRIEGAAGNATAFSECRGNASRLPERPRPQPEDPAFIFYTSGTTGIPKAVVVAHRTSEHRVVWLSTQAGLRHGTHNRTLGIVPPNHAIGFYGNFLVTLAYNGTFYVMSRFDPAAVLDQIERHRITFLFSIPTLYAALIAAPSYAPQRLASLELVLYGGAPIAPALLARIACEWPATVRHIYGTTEIMCSLYNPEPVGQPATLRPGYYSRVRVVKPGGSAEETTPVGEVGELVVDASADTMFSGYFNDPAATAARVRDGWYYTGDLCRVREDGDLDLLGRVDDVIRSGGESINPEEVEAVLAAFQPIQEACVIGIPDAFWGEMTIACIVLRDDARDWRAIETLCRSSALAKYKRPRGYFVTDCLPRNAANKVLRRELQMAVCAARDANDLHHFHSVD